MTEQQKHLQNLIEQRKTLEVSITKNRELLWKVQGAIEYLTQIGVEITEEQSEEQSEEVEEQ